MSNFSAYNHALLTVCAFMLVAVAALNIAVDPYRIWNVLAIQGLNAAKPQADKVDQMFKPIAVADQQPEIVFLGSSRVAYSIDPGHPAVKARGSAYNLSLLGGNLYSIRRNLEHALFVNPNLKMVFIGLDFFAFSETVGTPATFRDDRLQVRSMTFGDVLTTTLTLDVTWDSIQTVLSNRRDPTLQRFLPDGSLTAIPMRRNVDKNGMVQRFERSIKLYLGKGRLGGYVRSPEAYKEFSRIVDLVKSHDAELVAYINPVHALLMESIHRTGNRDAYHDWRRSIAALTPYWDFSGFNSVTTEPVAFKMGNFWDASHHRREVGNRMLDVMLATDLAPDQPSRPGVFGVYVDKSRVAARAMALEEERRAWLSANTEAVVWLTNHMAKHFRPN